MKFGITGHQERPGIDWAWVKQCLRTEIERHTGPIEGMSSLAKGADQVFAEVVLECKGSLVAVVPTDNYERFFEGESLGKYKRLLNQATIVNLPGYLDHESDFLAAGVYIADRVDCLLAVWDGQPSKGKGGTADIVAHALKGGKQFVHINPFNREVHRGGGKQHQGVPLP